MTSVAIALAAAVLAAGDAPLCAPPPGGAAGEACASTPDDVRERVHSLLGAIDRPVRPETWRSLGPEAESVLAESPPPTSCPRAAPRRSRGSPRSPVPARSKCTRPSPATQRAPLPVRRSAIRGLGRLVAADRLVGVLGGVLEGDGAPRCAPPRPRSSRAAPRRELRSDPGAGEARGRPRRRAVRAGARGLRALSLALGARSGGGEVRREPGRESLDIAAVRQSTIACSSMGFRTNTFAPARRSSRAASAGRRCRSPAPRRAADRASRAARG